MLSRETNQLAIAYLCSAQSASGGGAVRNGFAAVLAIICALAMASGGAASLAAPHGRAIASLQAATGAAATKPGSAAPGSAPLSTRVVAYRIDAKLDPATHTITATETLTYHNLTGQPQQDFPFHLYLNAFQPQSTWMAEQRLDSPEYKWKPEHRGAIRVTSVEAVGMGDVTSTMHFTQPDDTNTEDHTVMQIKLPKPVAAGADVQFKIAFEDQMPQVVARTGYMRDFYMVGQWFPKVGVWWKGAWNCHQFHRDTEFFADFGTFDVNLTMPKNEVVGAGGDLVSSTENSDGTKTMLLPLRRRPRFLLDRQPLIHSGGRFLDRQRRHGKDSPAGLAGKHGIGSAIYRDSERHSPEVR